MANLIIIAKLADLGVGKGKALSSPNAFTCFRDSYQRRVNCLPRVAGDSCSWTVPDTPENRDLLRRSYNDGRYSAKVEDEAKSVPFSLGEQKEKPETPVSLASYATVSSEARKVVSETEQAKQETGRSPSRPKKE
jgi:hypothetical protein